MISKQLQRYADLCRLKRYREAPLSYIDFHDNLRSLGGEDKSLRSLKLVDAVIESHDMAVQTEGLNIDVYPMPLVTQQKKNIEAKQLQKLTKQATQEVAVDHQEMMGKEEEEQKAHQTNNNNNL